MVPGKKLKISLLVSPPKWIRNRFKRTIWHIPVTDRSVFFTFDDGPIPEMTPWILQTLEKYHALATFFCVGENVQRYPELFKQIQSAGHAIGNHTYSHLNGYRTGWRKYVRDVYRAHRLIRSKLFRPPYGRTRLIAREVLLTRFKFIQWDVLSMDYDSQLNADEVVKNVIDHAREGSIVVFHDNLKARDRLKKALPELLEYYTAKGFTFKSLIENQHLISNI
ncbi:MAG: polysaccharide deacetylase family protein [Bacteroidales bacterium]|nr:polysaccharide deacetylase family protein [Bacteroidales bacterium]